LCYFYYYYYFATDSYQLLTLFSIYMYIKQKLLKKVIFTSALKAYNEH